MLRQKVRRGSEDLSERTTIRLPRVFDGLAGLGGVGVYGWLVICRELRGACAAFFGIMSVKRGNDAARAKQGIMK